MNRMRGFTMIELMIAVAIIAILAGVALPMYQQYVTKAQLAAALDEIGSGKNSFESELLSESVVTFNPLDLGLQPSTARYSQIEVDTSATGYIRCTLRGNPKISGRMIALERTVDGAWACRTSPDINPRYRPAHCD